MARQTESSSAVADFLRAQDRTSASSVRVKIGRTTYNGAEYCQVRDTPRECRAYAEGERTYVVSGFYLLGTLPASFVRDGRTTYVEAPESTRYYIAGWYGQDGAENEFHPLGKMFLLFSGDVETDGGDERTMTVDRMSS